MAVSKVAKTLLDTLGTPVLYEYPEFFIGSIRHFWHRTQPLGCNGENLCADDFFICLWITFDF